jgi:hypothetical protein
MSAPVERRHREQAFRAMNGGLGAVDDRLRAVLEQWFAGRSEMTGDSRVLEDVAQALADSESTGRSLERADVVAWLRNLDADVPVQERTHMVFLEAAAESIERGCHGGCAGFAGESGGSGEAEGE